MLDFISLAKVWETPESFPGAKICGKGLQDTTSARKETLFSGIDYSFGILHVTRVIIIYPSCGKLCHHDSAKFQVLQHGKPPRVLAHRYHWLQIDYSGIPLSDWHMEPFPAETICLWSITTDADLVDCGTRPRLMVYSTQQVKSYYTNTQTLSKQISRFTQLPIFRSS